LPLSGFVGVRPSLLGLPALQPLEEEPSSVEIDFCDGFFVITASANVFCLGSGPVPAGLNAWEVSRAPTSQETSEVPEITGGDDLWLGEAVPFIAWAFDFFLEGIATRLELAELCIETHGTRSAARAKCSHW
jgi:hypothetical protein